MTNERDERDERVKPTRIATLPEAHPFRRPRDEARGETVLEAARALGRRSVPSSLWGAAGHGGRDREIPEWVLGFCLVFFGLAFTLIASGIVAEGFRHYRAFYANRREERERKRGDGDEV